MPPPLLGGHWHPPALGKPRSWGLPALLCPKLRGCHCSQEGFSALLPPAPQRDRPSSALGAAAPVPPPASRPSPVLRVPGSRRYRGKRPRDTACSTSPATRPEKKPLATAGQLSAALRVTPSRTCCLSKSRRRALHTLPDALLKK